jgi:arylsulfatase A-like enzyme
MLGALLAAGPSCTDAAPEPLRRVVPLVRVHDFDARAAVLDEEPDAVLGHGDRLSRQVGVEPGRAYTLEVGFEGTPPRLFGGPQADGSLAPLRDVPGRQPEGWTEGVFHPAAGTSHVVVHATDGAATVRHVALRPWGAERGAAFAAGGASATDAGDGLEGVQVFGDHRLAQRIGPRRRWELPADVPGNATWLAFDVAPDPARPVTAPATAGLGLVVRLVAGRDARTLLERAAPEGRTAWETVRLDARAWAGRTVTLVLECTAPPGTAADAPGLAVSVPEWLCETGRRRPSLVLLSLDTTRPDHLGLYGYARDTSPELDAFAARSVVFEHAYSTAPYTLPAHASLFSGQYPTTHGVEHPAHALDIDRTPLLAAVLRAEGYATRAFTGGGYLNADFGFAHGFARYAHGDPTVPRDGGGVEALERSRWGRTFLEARRAQDWDAARAWVDAHREVPFFLFVHTYAVHDYRPSGAYRGAFGSQRAGGEAVEPLRNPADQVVTPYTPDERRQLVDLYDEAIREVDAEVGRLLAGLGERQRDTIVVVTSDHGEVLGGHELRGQPVVGHGMSLWEDLVRVPLLIHVPGGSARRVARRVSSVDVAPTLLDLLGVEVPPAMQGRPLRALLEAGDGGASPVLAELHSHRGDMRASYEGDLKLVTGDPAADVTWPVGAARRLFDLATDPGERHDLDAARRADAERLADGLGMLVGELRSRRRGGPRAAVLDEDTRRRLEELGYVDGG